MSIEILIILALIALCIQAFFAGSEIALISCDRIHLKKLSNMGHHGAKLALKLLVHPENVLSTTVLGTTICVTFQASLVTLYIFKKLGPEFDLYATLFLSPIVLIFGEIVPKTIAQRYSEKLAPKVAIPMQIARSFFKPVMWVLEKYTTKVSKIITPIHELLIGKTKTTHREDLKYILNYGKKETQLKSSERNMIRRIFEFSKMDAKKSMLPLVKVELIEDTLTSEEALTMFQNIGHSRLPVYNERVDNIVGILQMWDVFTETNPKRPIRELMQKPFFAPESQLIEDLLFTMKRRGNQMTIIVDEYGGAVGILTIEDILEEIMGDIRDELDADTLMYKQVSQNNFLLNANMEVSEINEILKLEIPKGNYETLSGFLLQQFNRIPEVSDELYYQNLKFIIRKATNRKIEQVEINVLQD